MVAIAWIQGCCILTTPHNEVLEATSCTSYNSTHCGILRNVAGGLTPCPDGQQAETARDMTC